VGTGEAQMMYIMTGEWRTYPALALICTPSFVPVFSDEGLMLLYMASSNPLLEFASCADGRRILRGTTGVAGNPAIALLAAPFVGVGEV
jgi:hypothetical protein